MRKLFLLCLTLSFLVSVLSISAFAAKAVETTTTTQDALNTTLIPEPLKEAGTESYSSNSGKEDNNSYSDLGYRAFSCAAGVSCIEVGNTWYDNQSNGTISRQIVMGTDNRVHFIWHRQGTSTATRFTVYRSWQATTATFTTMATISAAGGGYTSIDNWRDLATAAWHDSPDGVAPTNTRTGIQTGSGVGSFTRVYAPQGVTVKTGSDPAEGIYIWPVVDVDESTAGDTIVHLVAHESPPASEGNGAVKSQVYFRGTGSPYTVWDDTAGVFIDSVYNITAVVRADPNSDKVAVVYFKPRIMGDDGNQHNHDVVYQESSINGSDFPRPIVNITNYTGTDPERAYTDLSAMYDTDGFLHITYITEAYDSAAGTISTQSATLYHWSDRQNATSLVYDAQNLQNCLPGAWNKNISKVNISECFASNHVGQPNYSADGKMLYCVYTGFFGDTDGDPIAEDCSAGGWANGEIYVQSSSTYGASWGPPINITDTQSPGCASGACDSEHWPTSAMYVNDSLRISFVYDTDAGTSIQTEGVQTESKIIFATTPCYEMEEFVVLNVSPNRFCYPFNTAPGADTDSSFTLTNGGNASSNYTIVVSDPAIITSPAAGAGSIDFGLANAQTFTLTASGPVTEGLYVEWVRFDYNDGTGAASVQVDVDVYNFNDFYSPEDELIRTSCSRLAVSQVKVANQLAGSQLSYFDSPNDPIDLLYDGSIVFNYGGENHYMAFFGNDYCVVPAPDNQLLYALSNTVYDSTSNTSYRSATATGTTADSTIQYDVVYYAPKHPDSCDFYLAHFKVTAGPNKADVSNVDIGYAADIDAPDDDAGSDNYSGFDATDQYLWQKGSPLGSANDNDGKAVALGYYGGYSCATSASNPGGTVTDNPTWIYPHSNFPQDSLQTLLDTLASWNNFTDSVTDCNALLSVAQNVTISSTAYDFVIIFAGRIGVGDPVADLDATIAKAKVFADDHVVCSGGTACLVGDADGSGAWDISDAVYLITYIFGGGPAPTPDPLGSGDADCSGGIDISDAVYLITFIFGGGPAPGAGGCTCTGP